ncbi:MAG: peptide chain release factor N(5)-glutamine methyltransferase [Lachnospiraceae bacterium]
MDKVSTVRELYEKGRQILQKANVENPDYDARILLEWILEFNHADFILEANKEIEEKKEEKYIKYIRIRSTHYPLQYIMKQTFFMDFEFFVDEGVLIPRQDTEVLVEVILEKEADICQDILDICTGSGCIAISLKKYLPKSNITAVDISKEALEIAKINKEKLKADIKILESDCFENIEEKFDIMVSNPPYIRTKEIETLMDEVKTFEPMLALDGMEDGLFFYDKLLKEGKAYLKKGGRVYFEIGHDQAKAVSSLFLKYGYKNINIRKDLAGLDRVVYGVVD